MEHSKLAKLSGASYTGVKPIKKLGFNKVIKFRSGRTGTKGYLAIDDVSRQAVVVFRGTEKDGKDILTDISFLKTAHRKHKDDRIHKGFLRAYESIQGHINKEIGKLPTDYALYATGHSLGGALACLYALYGAVRVQQVVTFGQPRVGNKIVSKKLTELPYTRYVNHADIVPRVPRINYWHSGTLVYITRKESTLVNPSWGRMFVDRMWYLAHRFTDHRCAEYIRILE